MDQFATLRVPNHQPSSLDKLWEVSLRIELLTPGEGVPEFYFQL